MGLISIIMPVKNAAPFLEDCLKSIRNQSHIHWELVAIDDHSKDASLQILQEYATKDSRISFYQNPETGIISALQKALKESSGTYITRMDADDKMPDQRLARMEGELSQSGPRTIITGLVNYFSDGMVSSGYRTYEQWINEINLSGNQWNHIYRECVIASPNWMVRRDELLQIGGFDDLVYPEDYALVFMWYRNAFRIQTIPEVTLFWREHPQRTSRTSEHYDQRSFFRLKIREFIAQDYASGPLVIWGNNRKTQLIKKILKSLEISWTQMDVSNYKDLAGISNPQVLIAVYPPATQRKKISEYLKSIGLEVGRNYWYV